MNPELEALLKAWDSYQQDIDGKEARELRSLYDALVECVAIAHKGTSEPLTGWLNIRTAVGNRLTLPGSPSSRQERDMTPYS